ncbi:MAG: SDR family NAD(P)-dependent oxidoreductase [Planctomycetia bacterium]|nr:SDR family NAD(P)-dependent oxidoreductase [Planctomycetia bacterium]
MKTVLITGASQGLGKALSESFSERGYFVYACGFSKEAPLFGEGKSLRLDVSDETAVRETLNSIDRLDVLINNARFTPTKPVEPISESEWWDRNLDISLKGTYLCCVAALEKMKHQENGGCIINVSSIRGIIPNDWDRIPYGAAKAGQISLTRSFALAGGAFNVRVNAFLPGAIGTENLLTRISPERHAEICQQIPLHRIGTIEEMCHAIHFLVENRYMTGACLNCSGGLLLDY